MKKIAFFLYQHNIQEKDLSELLSKSYRLGGSELEFLLVSLFVEQRDNGIKSYFLTNYEGKLPHHDSYYVQDLDEACKFCVHNSIKEMIIDIKQFKEDIIRKYSQKLNFLIWAHNNVGEYLLNLCLIYPCVKKIICVSKSQMDAFKDHPAVLKTCYIYNVILFKDKDFYRKKITSRNQHNVVYMGCIRPDKGFHALAKAWPDVIAAVSDAQLYVIGNGQLYGKNVTLGNYGIASREYEDEFMPYLTDDKGEILSSVHFVGLLGDEKYDVLGMCKVGVPNPTGESETFCISGIEMELMGCSVTTLKIPVYEETQMNVNYLFDNEEMISDFIIKRLNDTPDNFDELYDFVTNRFSLEKSISRWEQLIKTNDVTYVSTFARIIRSLKLLYFKYYFLSIVRVFNFVKYRIGHHILNDR